MSRVENLLHQHLKPWAYTVHGNRVYVTRGNVNFIRTKLKEAGIEDVTVYGSGTNYVYQNHP